MTARARSSRLRRSGRRPQGRGRGLNAFERGTHIQRVREASSGIFDEAAGDGGPELGPDVSRDATGSSLRIAALSSNGVLPLNGRAPVAISYNITPSAQMSLGHVHVLAAQLFGRHVRQRADGRPRLRERGVHLGEGGRHVRVNGALRQSEVQNLDAPIRRDDDIVALQIAMNDATLVRVREGVRELASVVHDLLGWQRARVQHRAERPSFDQLHRDVGLAVGFADFVHRADVGMIQCRGGACFPHQSRACCRIVEARGGKDFDRDVAIELLIAGPIHLRACLRKPSLCGGGRPPRRSTKNEGEDGRGAAKWR